MELDFFPFAEQTFTGKVTLPKKKTILKSIPLQKYEIDRSKLRVLKEYDFIDLDSLLKRKGKKYTVAELRDIAKKLNIPVTNKKLELVRLIKLKINIE